MERDVKEIVRQMTLEEKAGMCSGKDFWHLKSVERLGIPEVMVSDGPHGLRKQAENGDHLGINESIKAVCFPAACATACSFDRDLLEEMGAALGTECQAENVSVLLGPAVNIKRSPLCGRNFEYFSEDPYLAGQMAKAHITGVQKEGVGTSIKHFAANNQEYHRMSASSEVDERTLREIYLAAFETPVKEAKPKTVMCSYNRINGVFASENPWLLDEVLRKEWGYEGYVMSDWGAVNDRVPGLKAGLELEMPASGGETDRQIVEAVKNGTLKEEVLDQAVERILNVIFDYVDHRKDAVFDMEKDHALAEKVETESMVLLKNDGILPLKKGVRAAFIGVFAKTPRYQGGGSSHINSFRVTGALEAAEKMADLTYAEGYRLKEDVIDEVLVAEAVEAAKSAEVAVIFAGLPDAFESEGYDRTHMRMPDSQNYLIHEVCKVQPNVVVVLHNGSPVEMPWAEEVSGILEAYLGGQGVGTAEVRILFGEANPCGKLAETIPYKLSDNPSYLNFPGDGETVAYREGIFVGYRYYDRKEMPVRYPFGYGLSYTEFSYSNLQLDKSSMKDTDTLTVSVDITNTGKRAGKEIVQLYVADRTGSADRPVRELKNFAKVSLEPGETETVRMELNKRSFAWYNVKLHDWYAASGTYEIQIGKSSREIVLCDTVELTTDVKVPMEIHKNTTVGQLLRNPDMAQVLQEALSEMMSTMGAGGGEASTEAISPEMIRGMMESMPLRGLRSFAGMSEEALNRLVEKLREVQ
ncbi:MAG TPA: glycoside hydrolase family 3 C-terminal domain-containing protein [Candidatus Fusicatenibacter intestinigallinarum]|uniref:Glycoside hydrolase family 3 C-terminal domain-containing protein n=1 Tax=Candidatus Fusicatenibacter intestinigallinarum TaxID=2838598 RepID=A0A9D2NB84_9FIRM|nr:glycoside hydrolase family 3 C-terminal domain-containing protein [Candidatus Fusicatenibacter intestinigallinarum]